VFEVLEKVEHAQFYLRTDKRGMGWKCFKFSREQNAYQQLFKAGRESGGEAVPGEGLQFPAVEGCQCDEIFVAEFEA
jgi:hypothetical protein